MDPLVSITMTAADVEALTAIGRELVGERLVACVNVVPGVRSLYRWDGSVQDEGEALAICHTRALLAGRVFARVRELHPYQTPQLVALPFASADADYAQWVCDSTLATPEA